MTALGRTHPRPNMAASSDIPMQIAETIQTAHINRAPSAAHDINPSTAADTREPVRLVDKKRGVGDDELEDEEDEDDVPVSLLRPRQRFSHLPPIPDLRFEQSYLHSIRDAKTWWMVAWITTRDQVCRTSWLLLPQDLCKEMNVWLTPCATSTGYDAHDSGCRLQPILVRMAALEQECSA